jgi:dihydroflavonol-4-reductase
MNHLLITGISGFIGGHLAEHFIRQGTTPRALVRNPQTIGLEGESKLEKVQGDLADLDSIIRAVQGVDIVYHLAAELKQGVVRPEVLFQVNADGAANVVNACLTAGVRKLVFCSSVGVLGNIEGAPATESAEACPDDDYEKSKYEGELIALGAGAHSKLDVVIVRPAWVYGPRDTRTLKLFRMINKGRMMIVGNGRTLQHPVHVSDVVKGIVAAGERRVIRGSIFHLAGPRIVTIRELLELSARLLGARLIPLRIPLRPAILLANILEPMFKLWGKEAPLTRGKLGFFTKNRAYSIETARKLLNYEPTMDLEAGLRQTFTWYRENGMLN